MKLRHVASILFLLISLPAGAQDSIYPKADQSGKGAVLCTKLMLLGVQALSSACHWAPIPMDDQIKLAQTKIDQFIIKNAGRPVTQQELDYRSKQYVDMEEKRAECKFDPKDNTSGTAFAWMMRQSDPAKFAAGIDDELSVPREPLIEPCL